MGSESTTAERRLRALLNALGHEPSTPKNELVTVGTSSTQAIETDFNYGEKRSRAEKSKAPHEVYDNEPERDPRLRVNKQQPFNAEPLAKDLIRAGFITPDELFLSRNHGPIPLYTDVNEFTVTVDGLVRQTLCLTLNELKTTFAHVEVAATIQCAGNRRNEFARAGRKVKGVGWETGALSTGVWGGVRLADVLARAGISSIKAKHVAFEGDDHCHEEQSGKDYLFKYGVSIPLHKALDPIGDVILAYEMNGQVLSRDRGYPLRVVVPGHIGARSVKWLRRITVQETESDRFHQQRDYKLFPNTVDWNNVEPLWSVTPSLQELSVQSVICEPEEGCNVGSSATIRGYALSGGGRRIHRVDVSFDNGATWNLAECERHGDHEDVPRNYAWILWSYPARNLPSPCTVMCRAWDSAGNTQPETPSSIWNLRGVMNNSWHRITINCAK